MGSRSTAYQYDPIALLDAAAAHAKRFPYAAKTVVDSRAWQKRTRAALTDCLGFLDTPKVLARRAWRIFGADENLETDYFEGRHRINGPAAYEFLARHLNLEMS